MTDPTDYRDRTAPRDQMTDDEPADELPDLNEWRTTPDTQFEDIYGLTDEKQRLRETVVTSMQPDRNLRTNSVFLYGQGDAGVTNLADALTNALAEDGFSVYQVPLDAKQHRDAANPLAHYVEQARDDTPCVLQVNRIGYADIDAPSPTRDALERLDEDAPRVVIIATTTLWNVQGRDIHDTGFTDWLDVCLHIDRPDAPRRRAIIRDTLETLCEDHDISFDATAIDFDAALQDLTDGRGYVLKTVAKRTIIRAEADEDATECRTKHLATATSNVAEEWNCQPDTRDHDRATNELDGKVAPTVPDVSFDDVGGLDEVKQRVHELVVYPREYQQLFERSGVTPAHGLLLHGPPGTGKTLLAKAVANATDCSFLAVQGPELKSVWFGQTEAQLREIFRLADEHAPSVVFFDEFDAIAGTRSEFTHEANRSVVTTLLAELDGLEDRADVLFLAATNRPDTLDPAVTRAGRFGEAIEVPLPDWEGRKEIFSVHASDLPTTTAVTPTWFTEQAPNGVSGADIASICERSLYEAIRETDGDHEDVQVTRSHVIAAMDTVIEDNESEVGPSAFV